jgi:hypothetical protein
MRGPTPFTYLTGVESSSIAANPGHVSSRWKQASKEYQEHGSVAVIAVKENLLPYLDGLP